MTKGGKNPRLKYLEEPLSGSNESPQLKLAGREGMMIWQSKTVDGEGTSQTFKRLNGATGQLDPPGGRELL